MVPELISHDMERRLSTAAGDTASLYAEVVSFTRLARRVADSVPCALEPCLDNGGRVVAMASASRQLHSKLKAYAAVETKSEFLSELLDAVDEFKRCCITPADLKAAANQTEGSLSQKLQELSLLMDAYDALCHRGKRDPRDQMTWLLECLQECDYGENRVFYIDGFPDFTRQHLAILEHLIKVSPNVVVSLNCDEVDSRALAFEKAGATAAQLVRCASRAGVEVKITKLPEPESPTVHIAQQLFQGRISGVYENLTVMRAESVHQECTAVAERIMALVRSGCRYRDISVVCGDLTAYQNVLSMVFHRCNIPIYLSGTEDILRKSVISTVLSAMEAALEGFDQKAVFRYMKSVLSPISLEDGDMVENYAILWGIRGSQWHRDWVNHPDELGGDWTDRANNKLAQLNHARKTIIAPLLVLRDGFRDAKNMAQQVEALYHFLESINLADRLDTLAQDMDRRGDNRSAQILNQLWEILLTALEQLHDVLGETVWDTENFTRLFTLLLSQYDVGTIPPVLDAVVAGSVSAMRCQEQKHLFVLGAAEGSLPGYGGSGGILTDQERTLLRHMGVPLTGGAMEGIQAEFAEIYGVFCGARETVWVSCPAGQPSFIYNRLSDLAGFEQTARPELGAALGNAQVAAAYLARWNADEEAARLGLDAQYRDAVDRRDYDHGTISRENIDGLYGDHLRLSASQIDCQADCRMSYFLKYGLRARERKEVSIDAAEFGTYVHAVLEQTAKAVMEQGGFHAVSLEDTMALAHQYSREYAQQRFKEIDSQRVTYLFNRNVQELEMIVRELWDELRLSKFQPRDFETPFGEGQRMGAIEFSGSNMSAQLRGFVDRVDVWQEDGRNYFRVVDYKTGRKSFDYCDVFNGLGLQMLLYLFALEQEGESILGDHPKSAGVQYFPARAPMITSDGRLTDEEAAQERESQWVRKGLLLSDDDVLHAMEPEGTPHRLCCKWNKDGVLSGDVADRQQLKLLKDYIFKILTGMVDDIACGNVQPNPYTRGTSHNACRYCPYGAVCNQSEVSGRRNYQAMSAKRFWEEIGKEMIDHG
jgi:ATP-dependent helicase/nuclease subunit B